MAAIPYQAYKSKRHSRVLSGPPLDPPVPTPNGLPSPPASSHSNESPDSPLDSPKPKVSVPSTSFAAPSTLPVPRASKFRHVSPNKPLPRSNTLHVRTSSAGPSSPLQRVLPAATHLNQSEPQLTSGLSGKPLLSPSVSERALPPIPGPSVSSPSPAASRTTSFSGHPPNVTTPTPSPSVSRSHRLPYKPGFQPQGSHRYLSDEFLALRKVKRNGTDADGSAQRVERNKLERRLEKLIDLHFPLNPPRPGSNLSVSPSPNQRPQGSSFVNHGIRRASSIFDPDTYKNLDANTLWKSVVAGNLGDSSKPDKREMEQRITPWEADSAVSKCPTCSISFHPLTVRRHHCRLCGRIICSLPPKNPIRPVSCSVLFVVDPKTRMIEEVGEGVDYGVRKRKNASIGNAEEIDKDEKFLKGVRLCRNCRPVLLREQYKQERLHVPTFVLLHEMFISLEKEIEDALPQFQELLLTLNHDGHPTKEASAARKRLLEAFAQYDALAKKIAQLPTPDGPGSSQARIQSAILMRANLFLQKNMFPLKSLPGASQSKNQSPTGSALQADNGLIKEPDIDPDSELAQALQPLLEQEALLETFVEEAVVQRKFEDVKTLKANLREIRKEIERMLNGGDVNSKKGKDKSRR